MSSVLRSRTIRQLAATADPPVDAGSIDLMGWDTVFALSLDALNASIRAQNTTPASFHGADPLGGAVVDGSWDVWSIIGGEGDGIFMRCPVRTGTLTMGQGTPPITLDGGYVEVEITLVAGPASNDLPDPTAQPGSGQTQHFTADGTSSDPFQQPKVRSVDFANVTGYAVYAAQAAFNAYFLSHLGDFNAVFAAVRLEEEAIETDRQWLKPQVSLYAMASQGASGARQSYFGLLSLTSPLSGRPVPQQNFDLRMFDYFPSPKKSPSEIIQAATTNSVFAVSGPLAMRNMILSSAAHCVKGASPADFELINDGITVVNKNELDWGDFQWDADAPDTTVTPVIAPGNFQLTLDGANFHLLVSQAAFTTPDGSCDVEITTDQFFTFGATKLNDGRYYFTPGPGLGTNSVRADVTANKTFQIASIIVSVVAGVALAFLGGSLGADLDGTLSTATQAGEKAAVEGSEEALSKGLGDLSQDAVAKAEQNAVGEAGEAIASNGQKAAQKTGMFANKFKIWGGVLGGMLAIPIGLLPAIMTEIYSGQITTGNVPTMDEFATNFTHSIQWPEVKSWELTGGTFAGAFLLGGHAS